MSETLAEAGRKADSKPYVCCKFADHGVESPHLSWTQLYSGTEGDQFNDAVIASDGSINRIRASGGKSVPLPCDIARHGFTMELVDYVGESTGIDALPAGHLRRAGGRGTRSVYSGSTCSTIGQSNGSGRPIKARVGGTSRLC